MAKRVVVLTSSRELPGYIGELTRRMARHLKDAERENIQDALTEAEDLSKGRFTPYEIRRLHPYSRSNSRLSVSIDPAYINVDTSKFLSSWRIIAPRIDSQRNYRTSLVNDDPKARFLLAEGGTRHMIERPLGKRVVERIRIRVQKRRRDAVSKALQGT
jgi:hypothetical protein